MRHTILILVTATAVLAALAPAGAAPPDPGFLRTEREVTGRSLSGSWQQLIGATGWAGDQIGGDGIEQDEREIGGSAATESERREDAGPSNKGDKVKAGALSLVLPGAGQFYNGDRKKAYIMAGVEVGIWVTYFVFDNQGDDANTSARSYAGIYAGTSGEHGDEYWRAVGQYMDSDAYNIAILREARATGTAPTGLVGEVDAWQWVNEQRREDYQGLRADANSAYDRRDFMILFAVVNRAVSIVDAVMGAGKEPGVLDAEVLGMDVGLGVIPAWDDPGARLTVSRSF